MRDLHPLAILWFALLALPACGDNDTGPAADVAVDSVDPADTGAPDTGLDTLVDSATAPDTDTPVDTTTPDTDTTVDDTTVADTTDVTDTADDDTAPADTEEVVQTTTCIAPPSAAVANAHLPDGFCASIWADDLAWPRGLFVTTRGDALVVESGGGRVTALWDEDGDGLSGPAERAQLAAASGLNHGVFVHGGYLYASSPTTVWRWAYAGTERADLGAGAVVVRDIPSGGHSTRTVVLDDAGRLYVSVGSANNVDDDSSRARVRRFAPAALAGGPVAFADGEVFADGLRNEVGLAFDAQGVLWGVQNGIDVLRRADLGGDIHEDNPAEILSRFDTPGAFHGYPYCWTEFLLPAGVGLGPGTMWAHASTMNDGTHTDAWCRDPANVDPPELAMQAHSAPLDLELYGGAAFPQAFRGDWFITFHGSWNRDVPTGYKVVHVPMDEGGRPQPPEPFFEYGGGGDIGTGWVHRPVGIRETPDGRLLVSSDRSGVIIAIGYAP